MEVGRESGINWLLHEQQKIKIDTGKLSKAEGEGWHAGTVVSHRTKANADPYRCSGDKQVAWSQSLMRKAGRLPDSAATDVWGGSKTVWQYAMSLQVDKVHHPGFVAHLHVGEEAAVCSKQLLPLHRLVARRDLKHTKTSTRLLSSCLAWQQKQNETTHAC